MKCIFYQLIIKIIENNNIIQKIVEEITIYKFMLLYSISINYKLVSFFQIIILQIFQHPTDFIIKLSVL